MNEIDHQVELAINSQDLSECVAVAVDNICDGVYWGLMVNLGHNAPHDPKLSADYGRQLLIAAIDAIRKEAQG